MNRYLRDRMMRRDERNPYGSRGGYVVPTRNRGRDRNYYGNDYYNDYRDYNMNDYDYESKEWEQHLHRWIERLKQHDKFNLSKEDIIKKARSMGISFDKYNEHELVATYYMIVSDYSSVISDPHIALAMAKDFLEDKDSELKGSDKLCAYYYEIIKGGENY